jgi:hypothetical protein
MNVSELAEGIGVKQRSGINRSIEALSRADLITFEDVQPRTRWVKLTKRGDIVAQCMYFMIGAINEIPPENNNRNL